jgi:GTPase SAR1 family protein
MVDLSRELRILKETRKVLEQIENANSQIPNINLIGEENKEEFEKIKEKLENYIWKIENNILEVAFVGLEKAGKSTFANAFIGRELLPSKRERATYIPTEVRYSEEGKVEVYFYSKEEFLKVFRSMLKDVAYPNWENVTLETITVGDFKKHFNSLEKENKELYDKHKNRLERDILEILEKKEEINKLLTGSKKIYKEDEIEEYKKFIIDPHLSRAVKRVIIYSSKLKGLENVVIYDLPGFDSPTFTHISYTTEFLKKADAIVFVREADKPSLKGPEVDVLQKTKEEDGVPIKEKLFFFLTKVDILETPKEVKEVKRKFIEELKRNDLFLDESRIFLGSAKAYFERDKKESSPIWQKLKLLGFNDDGIDRIKQALVEYNQRVRRKLLKSRVNRFLENQVKPFMEKKQKEIYYLDENFDAIAVSLEEVGRIVYTLKEKLEERLNKLIYELKKEIEENKPLTTELKEKIPVNITYPEEATINRIRLKIKSEDYTVKNLRPSKFNKELRDFLRKQIRETFTATVVSSLKEKIQQAEERFIKLILESFEEVTEINDIHTLEKNLKAFLSENLKPYSIEQSGLKALVERFSGDLIDLTMIPLTDVDREEKFKTSLRDFISLAAYDEDFDFSKPLIEHPLIYKLLTHKTRDSLTSKVDKILKKIVKEHGDKIFNYIPYGELVQLIWKLQKEGFKYSEILEYIEDLINREKSKEEKSNQKDISQSTEEISEQLLNLISQFRKGLEPPKTYEDVENEIKTDLEILKELLSGVVLRAINAERAYAVAVVNYGNLLKDLINTKSFFDFVAMNRHLLLGSKYQKVEEWRKYKPILENLKQNVDIILKIL